MTALAGARKEKTRICPNEDPDDEASPTANKKATKLVGDRLRISGKRTREQRILRNAKRHLLVEAAVA